MDTFNEALRTLLLFAPVFILSLSIHEFAHAWSANKLGDSTSRYLGRMTIDPMAHISWVGTVILPAIMILTNSGILFGWANPVPVDLRNFKKPRLHMAYVAAAGPASNIILAILSVAGLAVLQHSTGISPFSASSAPGLAGSGASMLLLSVQLNLTLAFFNLIPIPPLDGSRILQGFVSENTAERVDHWGMYGQFLLLFLLVSGLLRVLTIPIGLSMQGLFVLFGLR